MTVGLILTSDCGKKTETNSGESAGADSAPAKLSVAGKLQGTYRRWHENGVLAEEVELKEGQPDGLFRAFYPSGCLKSQVTLRMGKVVAQKFWEDGERKPPP